ncbi:MAG: mechanosensitive ion channel [Azonexus sp.]|jgi:small-conductance mechanosensitive channel|nr:mechanosensitive ion channel [Azonexus sp.]
MNQNEALTQLKNLWEDMHGPDFIWQVVALAVCLGLALLFSNWWEKRLKESAAGLGKNNARLGYVSTRLAFPLTGLLLTGLALPLLAPFIKVNLLKLAVPLFTSLALVRVIIFVLYSSFPKARWLAPWGRIISTVIWFWLALYITDLAPFVIDALASVQFSLGHQQMNLWMVLHGALTVLLTIIAALWVAGLIENRLMRMAQVDLNLRTVAVRFTKTLLTLLAILISLPLVGIDITAFSVFTGALGVGLGFGLQKIASSYVSGFIILLDRSIRIGNIIQIDDSAGEKSIGEVSKITTRYTVLKHAGGTEFIVPNEILISSTVQNQTYSNTRLRLATTIGVAYDSDLDLVSRLMIEAAKTQPRVLAEPPPRVALTQFADSAINLELGFWIDDPVNGKGNILSDINFTIWRAFKANGVEIPFPQREVRILNGNTQAA